MVRPSRVTWNPVLPYFQNAERAAPSTHIAGLRPGARSTHRAGPSAMLLRSVVSRMVLELSVRFGHSASQGWFVEIETWGLCLELASQTWIGHE